MIGAHLSISGREVLHNSSAAGSAFVMEPCPVQNQPARYGTIIAIGVAIDAAGPLLTAVDLNGADPVDDSGHFFAEGCHGYHSQREIPFVNSWQPLWRSGENWRWMLFSCGRAAH